MSTVFLRIGFSWICLGLLLFGNQVIAVNRNLHLQESSPFTDKATNNAPNSPDRDIDGSVRIIGGKVDISANEFNSGQTYNILLISPSGTIDTATPTYRWQAVTDATWYYLWVNDASGHRIDHWYTATEVGCPSGSGECAVTPIIVLQAGAGQWWVQTYGAGGYGPWSQGMSFTLVIPPPPAPVPIAPSGAIYDVTPTYRWWAVANATWYYLWVNDASGNRIRQWYTAAQAGCASGSGECAVTPTVALQAGAGQWWVQTYGAGGYGPWSQGMSFTLVIPPPPAPVPIAPSGAIYDVTPTYRWQAAQNATWYYLWVNDTSGHRIDHWYTAAQAGCPSGSGECAITPDVTLQLGAGQWWVQAYSAGGYGPWSQEQSFLLPSQVSYESGTNTIRLSVVGSYSSDYFDLSSISPATYDPVTKRIFVPMNDLAQVDVLDISNPAKPKKVSSILTLQFGGGPYSVDVKNGILAVALDNPVKTLPGTVVFFDVHGDRIGGPVTVGSQPALLAFTPDERHVVVANEGEANDEYTTDPEGSISIIDVDAGGEDCHTQHCQLDLKVHTLDFDDYNNRRAELIAAGVRIYGPRASVAQDLEPESVAISPDSQTAWVVLQRNNAVAVVDIPNNRITTILPLGYKDHSLPGNGFDASDVDGAINIQTWPVRSFYEADIVAPFQVNGTTYLVTANEGDPRDFSGYSELARVSELRLDPVAFPNAASLQQNNNLGRLHVNTVEGDTNKDGFYDQIYMLGSRSFAIWTTDWKLVFDSGDQLEQITAKAIPQFFNTSDDETHFDQKSDERGPEPEELAVGQVGSHQYVFIAPERIGGLYVYDITDPTAPVFQQYINYRNFTIDPAAVCEKNMLKSEACSRTGDLGPEGVLFIPADQSPIGVPLVAITNEVSGSTTLYRIDELR